MHLFRVNSGHSVERRSAGHSGDSAEPTGGPVLRHPLRVGTLPLRGFWSLEPHDLVVEGDSGALLPTLPVFKQKTRPLRQQEASERPETSSYSAVTQGAVSCTHRVQSAGRQGELTGGPRCPGWMRATLAAGPGGLVWVRTAVGLPGPTSCLQDASCQALHHAGALYAGT